MNAVSFREAKIVSQEAEILSTLEEFVGFSMKLVDEDSSFIYSPGFFVESGHVSRLFLSRLDLTALPEIKVQLKKLRYLDVSINKLTALPEDLSSTVLT